MSRDLSIVIWLTDLFFLLLAICKYKKIPLYIIEPGCHSLYNAVLSHNNYQPNQFILLPHVPVVNITFFLFLPLLVFLWSFQKFSLCAGFWEE